jgi:hypothetical protein
MSDLRHIRVKKKPGFTRLFLRLKSVRSVRGGVVPDAPSEGALQARAAQARGTREVLRAFAGRLHLPRYREEVLAPAAAHVGGETDLHETKLTQGVVTFP